MSRRAKDLHIKSRAYAIQKITRLGKHQCEYCSDRFRTQRQLNLHSVKHRNTAMSTRPRRVATAMSTRPRRVAGAKKPHATTAIACLRLHPLVFSYSYPVKSYGPKETRYEREIRYLIKKRMRYFIKKRRYLNGISD